MPSTIDKSAETRGLVSDLPKNRRVQLLKELAKALGHVEPMMSNWYFGGKDWGDAKEVWSWEYPRLSNGILTVYAVRRRIKQSKDEAEVKDRTRFKLSLTVDWSLDEHKVGGLEFGE